MSLRRMVPFILINVVVSATVVLLILYWWDSRQPEPAETATTPSAPAAEGFATDVPGDAAAGEDGTPGADEETTEANDDGDGSTVHVVQAGDTLGLISQLYDVPVEEIAAANEIIDVNTISVGQELLIPIGGLPAPTAGPTAAPTGQTTATPLPTEPPDEGTAVVEISEVIGIGDLTAEAVRISNAGSRPAMLRGWELFDEDGNVYTFVDVTLFGSSDAGTPSILVHTEAGQNGPSDLFWGLEAPVWEVGETATLRDPEGTVQATYEIP